MQSFQTLNDVVREFQPDLRDWVNVEFARFLRRRVYEQTEPNLVYYPEHLRSIFFTCPNGHMVSPSWLEKRPPILPFRPRQGGLFFQTAAELMCTTCQDKFHIELPVASPWLGEISLYGDEAFRDIDIDKNCARYCVTYTLISRPILEADDFRLTDEFSRLKRQHFGHSNRVHCKELFHSRGQGGPTTEQASAFIGEVADLIASFYGKIVVFNAAGVTYKPENFKKREVNIRKALVFGPLVQTVIESLTKQGRSPRFIFERTGDDGWAKNLLFGGRLTLMWPFITNGLPVRSPDFVPPTDSDYLELADIISFAVADNIRNRALAREGKVPPAGPRLDLVRLGKVHYQGYTESGDVLSSVCAGYPWDKFFAGTAWE